MISTDFVLTLPNILGHRCTCTKSHDQNRLTPPRVRREFLILVKMAENLVGYARKGNPRFSLGIEILISLMLYHLIHVNHPWGDKKKEKFK